MTFLFLNSDKMGQGDDELGIKLMITFLRELANSDVQIDAIGCVNSAVNLTTKGSSVLEYLRQMEDDGARISTCKTCLDFFEKMNDLAIGEVGTMDQTVQTMANADKVIQPN